MAGKAGQARGDRLAERIEFVRGMLARCQTKQQIKKQVREAHGETDARTIELYISRAREAIQADAARGRDIMRTEQAEFYRQMMSTAAQDRDKIRAAERLDKLHGLEAPQQMELGGPGGKPIAASVVRIIRPPASKPVDEAGLMERHALNGHAG